jgi:phage shock protein PspC (stress-responsive transcriptional regulator)
MTEQQQANPQQTNPGQTDPGQTDPGQTDPGQATYQAPPLPQPPYRRLTRTTWDAPISGVCGGIARYLGVDPTLVRVLAVIAAVFTFPAALIAYVVMWVVIPKE